MELSWAWEPTDNTGPKGSCFPKETQSYFLKKDRIERWKLTLGYEGVIVVDPIGHSGGLAFFWRNKDEARLLSYSQNHVDVECSVSGLPPWWLTGMYGIAVRNLHSRTWDLMRQLSVASPLPWCIIGDLNNLMSQAEKIGGALYPNGLIDGFVETVVA